jgi:hypothetical protein
VSKHSSARIRTTSEINVKTNLKVSVFGEDDRIINPGDLLIEAVEQGEGDRLGANITKFEIAVAGRDIENLLAQVQRAAYLYRINQDWLSQPASRMLTQQEIDARESQRPVPHVKPVRVVDQERLDKHLLSLLGAPPKLTSKPLK